MKLGAWVVLIGLVLAGCGDDDDDGAGSSAARTAKVVAASLTSNVVFADGVVEVGDIPATSESAVSLRQEDQVLTLAPMATQILALEVDNPDEEDDPVTATLMQFEGDDDDKKHIEVPKKSGSGTDGGAASEINIDFTVGDDVCEKLCNDTFTISMIQAVKLKKGGISKHLKRTIKLDCTADGDPDLCEDEPSSGSKDGGTSGRGGSSSAGKGGSGGATAAATSAGQEFARALGIANLALCSCPEFMTPPCAAILPQTAVACIQDSAIANGGTSEVLAVINMLTADLKAAANACNSCDLTTCHPNVLKDALPMLPDDVAAEWEQCATDKGGMIGGTPADAGMSDGI
jgi:hypothetical protein